MMRSNRIDNLFSRKKERVVSIYMTAGFPKLDDTAKIVCSLQENGADIIEIGMPFSDPLADGPVIQESSQRALENGMNTDLLFAQLREIRKDVNIPLILMGYLNPVIQYGFERFIRNCTETGIDGLIIPDLPLAVYEKDYKHIVDTAGMKFIMLITPNTDEERVRKIEEISGGFIYMVADSSTTGVRNEISPAQRDYFKRINEMNLALPKLIGFGISNADTFNTACQYASGAIIGSAFIKILAEEQGASLGERIMEFMNSIKA